MKYLIFFLMFLALSFNVDSIAVASDYLENNTLELIGGTSTPYSIRLQNPTDYEAAIKVDFDDSYMKAIDYREVYTLAPRETGYKILFNITAPEKPGLYSVGYTVSEVESGGSGLGLLLKINRNFNLRVIEDPNRIQINYFNLAFAAALSALAFLLLQKNHKKKVFKKAMDCLLKYKIISKRRKYRKIK